MHIPLLPIGIVGWLGVGLHLRNATVMRLLGYMLRIFVLKGEFHAGDSVAASSQSSHIVFNTHWTSLKVMAMLNKIRVLLMLISFLVITTNAESLDCSFKFSGDYYGQGVRIGIYFTWFTS